MSCRRCPACEIAYPIKVSRCEVCDAETQYIHHTEPDPDWEAQVEFRQVTAPSAAEAGMREWRRRELEKLGFAGAMLDMLVDRPTDVHFAQDLIEGGCPLETAARILI